MEDKIIEGNKFIARFMGWEILPDGTVSNKEWADKYSPADNFIPEILSYHSSWDWLMPVVEKIEDVKTIGQRCYISISPYEISGYCSGVIEKNLLVFSKKFNGTYFNDDKKKGKVWEIVVEFIKWYNTQNK